MRSCEITQAFVKSQLEYLPEQGGFIWKVTTNYQNKQCGKKAGGIDKTTGYERISLAGRQYYTHRLVWLYHFGAFPVKMIDHINQCKTDNRVENLREASKATNAKNSKRFCNNTSGETGICWNKRLSRWRVYATDGQKQYAGGHFIDFAEAIKARDDLHKKLGFSSLHGNTQGDIG